MKSRTSLETRLPSTPGPMPAMSWGEDIGATGPQLQHMGSSTFTGTRGTESKAPILGAQS